jgi:AcrR family transcriptional regulator
MLPPFLTVKQEESMPRIVNEQEYTARRNEILDAALRFIYTKGYEQMTIQDILFDRQMSKGAFFHYFSSKRDMLEAMIERMINQAETIILPIVHNPHANALQKLQTFFDASVTWKTAQVDVMRALLPVWYADDNAIVRQKVVSSGLVKISPLLKEIILQGIQEGVMRTSFPDQIVEVIFSLMMGFSDTLAGIILAYDPKIDPTPLFEKTIKAHNEALERILGTPKNSLNLVDIDMIKKWLVAPANFPKKMI